MSVNIFVYGTLKRNEPNAPLMETVDAEFVGEARTVDLYPLTIASPYNVPVLVNESGKEI